MNSPTFKIHIFQLPSTRSIKPITDFSELFDLASSISEEQRSSNCLKLDNYKEYLFSIESIGTSIQELKEEAKQYLLPDREVIITDSLGNCYHIQS